MALRLVAVIWLNTMIPALKEVVKENEKKFYYWRIKLSFNVADMVHPLDNKSCCELLIPRAVSVKG